MLKSRPNSRTGETSGESVTGVLLKGCGPTRESFTFLLGPCTGRLTLFFFFPDTTLASKSALTLEVNGERSLTDSF